LKDLGVLGTSPCPNIPEQQCGWSQAYDINERGQIVGFAQDNSGGYRAVLWDAHDLIPRDIQFGSGSRARAINENGQIVGDNHATGEAFFRDREQVTPLGSLGGGWTRVAGINEAGTVAGTTVTAAGDVHGFVWSRTTGMRDLGAGRFAARGVGSIVVAINDRGDVLGYAVPCPTGQCGGGSPTRGILWRRLAPQTITRR
jgi:probable HAF family extracellular repeat protein